MSGIEPSIGRTRSDMAWFVIGIGFGGITIISALSIWLATDNQRPTTIQMVFTAVLPLFGTWVGAVLAYYFSKDNLLAASQTTLDTVKAVGGGVATEASVNEAMIPLSRIRPREDVPDDTAAKALVLRELYSKMKASGMSRIPVLAGGVALFVIHEPDIDKYAQAKGVTSAALTNADTLGSLLQDVEGATAVSTFVTVLRSATITDARAAFAKAAEAKDLFVTEDGSKTSKVLGWLTNSDLARSA